MTTGHCIGGCQFQRVGFFCDIIRPQVRSGKWEWGAVVGGVSGGRERVNMQPTRPRSLLTLPQLRIPQFLFFFPPSPLPHDGPASCGAGSQRCFLSQSPFMWSLPHVMPVDSEGRVMFSPSDELRQADGAYGPDCSYRWTCAAAIADAEASAGYHNMRHRRWFKSKIFHCFISRLPRPSKIVPLFKLSRLFFFFVTGFCGKYKWLSFSPTEKVLLS